MQTHIVLLCLVLCPFAALVNGQTCTALGGAPCQPKSAVAAAGYGSYYNGGPGPCLYLAGFGNACFTSTSGSLGQCDCNNAACSCSNIISNAPPPGSECTANPSNPANCQTMKDTYCALNQNYTACKYCNVNMANCNKPCAVGITDPADIALILDTHNSYRRNVSLGQEARGYPGPQPQAANMNKLAWDADLAYAAQILVDQCVFQHDKYLSIPNNPGQLGQNLATDSSSAYDSTRHYQMHIKMWYDEVACMPLTQVGNLVGATACGETGHYTQLVWAKTQKVGCGWIQYFINGMYKQLTACNYYPAGNLGGAAVYISGTPASQCPSGTTAENGLCK